MSDQKSDCQKLYEEYKALRDKTKLVAQTHKAGSEIKPQLINVNDLVKKEEIRKKLVEKCGDYLKDILQPDELFEIENG